MNNSVQRSVGQAALFSRCMLTTRHSPIIRGLTARSITGRSLPIEVHQYHGFDVHLIWRFTGRSVTSEACLARYILRCQIVLALASEVECGALEEMCTCLCVSVMHHISDKVNQCFRAPLYIRLRVTFVLGG
jgi:hypothetical protein